MPQVSTGSVPARCADGFTLLELLLTLVAVALVAAVAVPAWFARSEVTLENAALLLARDVRLAQNRAAFLRRPAHLVFDVEGEAYRVRLAPGEEPPDEPADELVIDRAYPRDAVFQGVEIVSVDLEGAGEAATLAFSSLGAPVGGARIVLGFRGDRREVRIDGETGFLSIAGSTSGWIDDGR